MGLFDKIKESIRKKSEEEERINNMIENSLLFTLDKDIVLNEQAPEGAMSEYRSLCAYLNNDKARKIASIITTGEEVLCIVDAVQRKNNEELFIVYSSKRVLLINNSTNKYLESDAGFITKIEVIKSAMMTQLVNMNDVILDINLSKNDFNLFYNVIKDPNARNELYAERIKYLCGITPIFQTFNPLNSGISIDANNMVVFHDRKINNYPCKYEDIKEYEIVEDNVVMMSRRTLEPKTNIGSSKSECISMNFRVTLNNGTVYEIPIIFPNAFKTAYNHYDSRYIKCFDFAKSLIDKLDSLNKDLP